MTEQQHSIEDVPLNGFHRLLMVRTGGAWLLDGYVLSIIGVVLIPLANELKLSDFWQGMIAASTLFGMFFGGFLGGWLPSYIGRQKLYFLGPLVFVLCSLGSLWAESGMALFILRFVIGIGIGVEYPVAGGLLAEFLPKKNRGPFLAALTILFFAGAALAYLVGLTTLQYAGESSWRLILASPLVIGVFLLIVRLGTPESPRWLVSKGRFNEAENVIRKVYGNGFSLKNLPEQQSESCASLVSLLRSGYGPRLIFITIFWTCAVIPVFAVYAFAPKVMQALHLTGDWEALGSIVITMLFVVGCVLGTSLVNVLGRRPLVIHSFLWSGIALLGLGAMSDSGEISVLILFGIYAIAIGGAQILELVYPNEIFPTELRTLAVGFGSSMSRIGAAVGTWLVPISLQTIGIDNTMYAAAAVTLVGLLASWLLAPETRAMTLHEAASLAR
ncbi:MFS transporter [Carnimonas nigrificans]|uniref:MFS transporter n=1 Tax=Carnimonas nigrificans TaxID=64323 RepID=UPI00046FE193|nr:MFS transporter [Carnimonas nigrificans]